MPSTSANPRYLGKPFLRLLECYVLDAIHALSEEHRIGLVALEPRLRRVFKRAGDWITIVIAEMELPENLPEQIRLMWARNCDIAKTNGAVLTPQQFAEMFVDTNLT